MGAAVGALCEPTAASDRNSSIQCASLKSNVGHMEACAGAAGFASLLLLSLGTSMVASNTQLNRSVNLGGSVFGECSNFQGRLNAHLSSMMLS